MQCWCEYKILQPLCKRVWQFFKKLIIELSYDLATLLVGIYPKELKAGTQWDICTMVLIAALCITYKQPKHPSVEEWINKMWYVHTMDYYTALKRKEILIHAITSMSLKNIMQGEISQTKKDKYCIFLLTWGTWNSQIHKERK